MKNNLLTILLFSTISLTAQQIQYSWHNYTTNDGLPSPEVYTVIQDSKGFLWFGTDNGVSRFDGYAFQNFGAKEGLMDNVINGIQEDAAGRIWFSSMWGKLYYFEKESIKSFKYNDIIVSYQKSFVLVNGFSRFEKTGNITEGGVLIGLSGLGILKITDGGHTELFAAPEAPALLAFKTKNKYIVVPQSKLNGISQPNINLQRSLYIFDGQKLNKQGKFRLTSLADDVMNARLNVLGQTSFLFTGLSIHRQVGNGFFSDMPYGHVVHSLITDEDGQIWTGEGKNGGLKIYPNADALGKKTPQILLEGITPVTLLRDRDGGYWVTTIEEGVFYLPNKKVQIFNQQNAHFPFDVLSSVEKFEKSKVFVGFWQGEVGIFDKTTSVYDKIVRLPNDNIFDMKWDAHHRKLWFGGALLQKWQDEKLTSLENSNDNAVAGVKKIALRYQEDAAWIICGRGLHEVTESAVIMRLQKNGGNVKSRIFSVFEDSKQHLWIGKQEGLYRPEKDSLVAAPMIHEALKTRVEDIAELSNGSLVFATKGNGLVIYDGKTAINLTKSDGLLTDMLDNLATDAKGNIWVGSLAGLHKLSPKSDGSWHIQPITMFHGLPSNEINDIALDTEGVYLATPKGLVFYRDKPSNASVKPLFLEYFKADKKNKDFSESNVLGARENDIDIAWNCINFQMFSKIPYRYRLNAKDEWRYTYNRSLQLPSLFEGDYFFEVQAQNEDGAWSDSLELPFTVLPYWFETWWFRSLLGLTAFVGGYLFYENRTEKLKKEHAIDLQINDLERSALATQMNPHFIFNCLNSIQFLIQREAKDDAMTYLSRFAKMVRFTLESTRRGKVTIDEEVEALTNYLILEKLRFKEDLDFTIHVDEAVDSFNTEIPAMLIQPFVENALKHGFDSSTKAAKILIFFDIKNDFFSVKIQDNGKGIDMNTPQKTSNFKYTGGGENREKTGVGIELSRQRLALHNGQNTKENLHIKPLLSDSKGVLGTEVQLKIRFIRTEIKT